MKSEKKTTKIVLHLPTWYVFILKKLAKKQGKTLSAFFADNMEAFFQNVSIYRLKELAREFREKYEEWLDD